MKGDPHFGVCERAKLLTRVETRALHTPGQLPGLAFGQGGRPGAQKLAADPLSDLLEGLKPGCALLEHLDKVIPEVGTHRAHQISGRSRKGGLFELSDHLTTAEEPEIASPSLAARVFRAAGGQGCEVCAFVDLATDGL